MLQSSSNHTQLALFTPNWYNTLVSLKGVLASIRHVLQRVTPREWEVINIKKVFIGNLSYNVTGDQLREMFAQAGEVVDAVVIIERHTGRSKGFGFIEFSTEEEAKKAIDMFNGKELDGREMRVNEAKQREEN